MTGADGTGSRHAAKVRAMRAYWRQEAAACSAGDVASARRASEAGNVLFWELMGDLESALERTSWAYLKDADLVRDGVHELVVALLPKLRDLSDADGARGWESGALFWTCFKRHAINLFTRTVQKNYGLSRRDTADGARRVVEQRQTDYALVTEAGDAWDPLALAADPTAAQAFSALLTQNEAQLLLDAIKNPRHRHAFLLDWQGLAQPEIAARLGVSVKTAYNWIVQARRDATAWAARRYEAAGEFDEWLSPQIGPTKDEFAPDRKRQLEEPKGKT